MLDVYVPVTSLLVMFVLGLCGYVCYLTGYRKAIADFPVDDVEHDEVAQLELRQTSTQERLAAMEKDIEHAITIRQGLLNTGLTHSERLDELEQQGLEERLDELEQQGLEERLDALEEQAYTEGYDRSPGSYWERLDIIENWKASLGKLSETSLPSFDDLAERVEELERVNTKQIFDERVEHSVPFGQWALKVSERSKTNQARVEDLEHTITALLVDRACSGSTGEES